MRAPPPRALPARRFPQRAFVPGHGPHPRAAHPPVGAAADLAEALDPASWPRCAAYLWGVDLFNHGYYWEAHEAWEGLWRQAAALPPRALLQGLIRLAAAGVKVRQGQPQSVHSHATAAHGLFCKARDSAGRALCGLDLDGLADFARRVAAQAEQLRGDPAAAAQIVFDQPLTLCPD